MIVLIPIEHAKCRNKAAWRLGQEKREWDGLSEAPPRFSASVGSEMAAFPRLNAEGRPLPVKSANTWF
jgi:hypothetical protein